MDIESQLFTTEPTEGQDGDSATGDNSQLAKPSRFSFDFQLPKPVLGLSWLTLAGFAATLAFTIYAGVTEANSGFWVPLLWLSIVVLAARFGIGFYLTKGMRHMAAATNATASKLQLAAGVSAGRTFYLTLALAVTAGIAWSVSGRPIEFTVASVAGILLVATPEAMALVVPLVAAVVLESASKFGLRVNSRAGFEWLADVDLVLLDKTRTLTTAERRFVSIAVTRRGGLESEDELLAVAAGLENGVDHSIARAIQQEAQSRGIQAVEVKDIMRVPGIGVSGRYEEFRLYAGGPALLTRQKIDIDVQDLYAAAALNGEGKTVVYVVRDDVLLGYLSFVDVTRVTSADAVWGLQQLGKKVGLLTGDAHGVAQTVAKQLNLDVVYGEVLPHQKAELVAKLRQEGQQVAVVGDPTVNLEAMQAADVSLAFGQSQEDGATESHLDLLSFDVETVVTAFRLSRNLKSSAILGFGLTIGFNAVAIVLASGVFGFVIPAALAAALSAAWLIAVTFNARRLWGKA